LYPFGLKHKGYNNVTSSNGNSTAQKKAYANKEMQDDLSLNLIDFGARMYDPTIGRWSSIDPLAEKYTPVSPYNYVFNSPIIAVDPNGEDVYLLIWATDNGEIGHAGIAVDNYKTVNVKDKNGKDVVDKNGNVVTKQVKDGTKTYYDLWPSVSVGLTNSGTDVKALYQEFLVKNEKELTDTDVSKGENRAADGVVKFTTSEFTDSQVKKDLEKFMKSNTNYNGKRCNCSDFAKEGVKTASGNKKIDASESIMFSKSTTPNKLYKEAIKQKNAKVIKNPGKKVNNTFIKGAKGN
jgi:RHS repeat-associated protein